MRRVSAFATAAALVLGVGGSADAAGTTPTTKKVVSGTASVTSCGTLSGISISWTVTANVVTSIALASIPSGCVGAALSLTLVNASNTALSSTGPITVTGTSQTLTPSGSPTATSVTNAYVSAVGP